MVQQVQFKLPAFPMGIHIITHEVEKALPDLPSAGVLHLFIQHTSAGISINENADPDVRHDFELIFDYLVPESLPFLTHTVEGPDDMPAHVKSSLTGHSVSIPIIDGKLALGTWQGIYLCEFRYQGGSRKLIATITT